MTQNGIKISIIIPVYNAEFFIEKCLTSATQQTYSNIEIIVVNDGSTDKSVEIIKSFESSDSRIKFLDKENGGIGSAYIIAFKHITGDFVTFLDSDDWLELSAVEKLVKLALDNSAEMVSFGFKPINENGQPAEIKTLTAIDHINTDNEGVLKTHFEVLKHPTLARLYNKSLFNNIVVFEQNIGIDEMMTPQLLANCNKAVYTSEAFYNVLIRQESVSRAEVSDKKIRQFIKVYKFLLDFCSKNITQYESILSLKYYNILKGNFIKTLGKLEYETHAEIINELRSLKKQNHLNKSISNFKKQDLFITIFIKMNTKLSFKVAKKIKSFI